MTTSNINYFRLMKKVKVMKYNLKIQFELDLGKMMFEFQTLERASGIMLSFPFMCLMSRLNS